MKLLHVFTLRTMGLVIPALLLFVGSGCERTVPRTDYFPLRDGNRWEYRLLDRPLLKRLEAGQPIVTQPLNEDLKPGTAHDPEEEFSKAEVVDAQKADPAVKGAASARRVALELREAIDELTYKAMYDTAEQVWSKRNGYVGFQSQRGRQYLLILPPHTGYKWVVTGPAGQDLFFSIESAGATVSTPAGEFTGCAVARQESRNRDEMFRYWFAPNVGLVRRSKYFLNEEVFRQELIEFSVRPANAATRKAEEREVAKATEGQRHGSEFRQRAKDARANRYMDEDESDQDPQKRKAAADSAPR